MPSKTIKLVVTVPLSHADIVRDAMGQAGAGVLGNYSFCSISSNVTGRFKPEEGATPHIGEIMQLDSVEEERIEVVLPREILKTVVEAIKAVHPYEEVSIDVYALESI
jgi:hypothetical protein